MCFLPKRFYNRNYKRKQQNRVWRNMEHNWTMPTPLQQLSYCYIYTCYNKYFDIYSNYLIIIYNFAALPSN